MNETISTERFGAEGEALEKDIRSLDQKITDAKSFDELYEIIEIEGTIVGSSGKMYTSSELKQIIDEVRETAKALKAMPNKNDVETVTHTGGLRDKVLDLLIKEMTKEMSKGRSN